MQVHWPDPDPTHPLKDAFELVMKNELPDAKSQMAIMKAYYLRHGRNNEE